jgi:hypothetical protein
MWADGEGKKHRTFPKAGSIIRQESEYDFSSFFFFFHLLPPILFFAFALRMLTAVCRGGKSKTAKRKIEKCFSK